MQSEWKKSSKSQGQSNCVEVRLGDQVGVRDSKNQSGPALTFPADAWRSFIEAAKDGEFDL